MALEDGAYEEAKDYFNRALDINSKEAEAYLGLFMVGIEATTIPRQRIFLLQVTIQLTGTVRARQLATGELEEELRKWEATRSPIAA